MTSPIKIKFYLDSTAPPLKNSPGKKKNRVGFLDKDSPELHIALNSKKIYKEIPKLSLLEKLKVRKCVILHVVNAETNEEGYLKVNAESLRKRFGIKKSDFKAPTNKPKAIDGFTQSVHQKLSMKIAIKAPSLEIFNLQSALDEAIRKNDIQQVKTLLKNPALQNALNARIVRLHKALSGEELSLLESEEATALGEAIRVGNLEIVKLLLENGASPDVWLRAERGERGWFSAVDMAAVKGRFEILKLLLDKGARIEREPDKLDKDPEPLLYAVLSTKDRNWDVIELLIEKGASLKNKYSDDYSLLAKAASRYDTNPEKCTNVLKKMIERGAKINPGDHAFKSIPPEVWKLIDPAK